MKQPLIILLMKVNHLEMANLVYMHKIQQYDGQLSERLQSDNDKLMIAIADNYGDLSKYTSESKSEIRAYMTDETRKKHETLLNKTKHITMHISRDGI